MPWGQKSEGRRGREARVVPTNTGELEEGQRNDHREGRHWVITDARFFLPLTKPIRGCQLVDGEWGDKICRPTNWWTKIYYQEAA